MLRPTMANSKPRQLEQVLHSSWGLQENSTTGCGMKLPHLMGEKNGYLMSSPILDTPQKITNSLQVNVENPIPKD